MTTTPAENSLSASPQRSDGYAKSVPLPDQSEEPRDDPNHVVRGVLADIHELDVARTTPMDALAFLHRIQQQLDDANQETRPRDET